MFWSALASVLTVLLTTCHLYDRLHRGLPGVVRKRSIGAGSAVTAAYLASMASGRTWGDFNDRSAGDPLTTRYVVPPKGRSGQARRAPRPGRTAVLHGLLRPRPRRIGAVVGSPA